MRNRLKNELHIHKVQELFQGYKNQHQTQVSSYHVELKISPEILHQLAIQNMSLLRANDAQQPTLKLLGQIHQPHRYNQQPLEATTSSTSPLHQLEAISTSAC
jgi:hypothetical protein